MSIRLKVLLMFLLVGSLALAASVRVSSQAAPFCGDGNVDPGEECDDANNSTLDRCDTRGTIPGNSKCSLTFCGDGIIQQPTNGNGQTEWCDQPGRCALDPTIECDEDSDCFAGGTTGKCTLPCTGTCGAKLLGWAWSDSFGWLSLNDDNCDYLGPDGDINTCVHRCGVGGSECNQNDPDACGDPQLCIRPTYFTQINNDGEDQIKGFAWSDTLGYVCFGNSCTDLPPDPPSLPPSPFENQTQAKVLDEGAPSQIVTGWANAYASPSPQGWFSLSCRNHESACTATNEDEGNSISDYSVRLKFRQFQPTACSGDECENFALDTYTLSGFAWNGFSDGGPGHEGLGWTQFDPPLQPLKPFLQTELGDIYALRGLRGSQPPAGYNSTFLILSGGDITNFTSAQGSESLLENFGNLGFLTPETKYSNILGRLDLAGLTCAARPCTNSYGTAVEEFNLEESNPDSFGEESLEGKVYQIDNDVVLNTPIVIKNGDNFENGSGTVIIDGDLTINSNITYQPPVGSGVTRFRNLASIAWIIKGDVMVHDRVTEIAGNFIILGDGTACNSLAEGPASCGQAFTCFDGGRLTDPSTCENQLSVSGLMMARKFFFDRSFISGEVPVEGSEVIIYDGRLLANTPPGLEDFVQALPKFGQQTIIR